MITEDADDRLIIAEIIAGDAGVFRLLVLRYEKAVFSMGMSFFHNREDASDFSQEVFLKVFQNLFYFRGDSRFSTWLYSIAYNTGINGIKRRKEYRSLAEEEAIPDFDTPEKRALLVSAREAVKKAVAGLPERYRICIDLFFFYDRSYQEIEIITGYPVNTIKSHIFRAKKLLQGTLGDLWES
ncbi:MAG: sigma-70 family RNA polymerase sigma factor [Spirochaetaceae bacterium]|jgi:RNA polymerase sigma-70 factor (ECF subfamily)|nr:sigma-70 family RNA polymerase sigma factor [Spirochaetaceae bacterium]